MLLTFKTLQGQTFTLEVDATISVSQEFKNIAENDILNSFNNVFLLSIY